MDEPIRMLLVEDSEDDALLIASEIRNAGFDLTFKKVDTRKAMKKALEQHNWDAIIADYALPNFNAIDALKLIEKKGLDIPFIIVSRVIGEEAAVEAMRAGAHDYLMKDNLTRLVPVISRELREARNRRECRLFQEGEQRYQILTEASPVGIFRADVAGACNYVNERWCDIAGMSARKAMGDGWFRALHPEDHDRVVREWRYAVNMRLPFVSEFRFRSPMEEFTWVVGRATLLKSGSKVDGYIGTITDITERKESELALMESQKRFQIVSELTSDYAYAFRVEPNGSLVCKWVTGALSRITGYTTEELLALGGFESLVYPYDLSIPFGQLRVLLNGQPKVVEYRIHSKKGNILWVRDYGHPVWDQEQNRVTYIYGAVQDITERKTAEGALEQINNDLQQERNMFVTGPVVIFKWKNEEGWPVEYVSSNVEEVFGYSVKELTSGEVPYGNIIPQEDITRVANEVSSNSENGVDSFVHLPYQIVRKDGKIIWIDDFTTVLRNEKGEITHYLGYIVDITKRKQAEQTLRESEKKYRRLVENMQEGIWLNDKDAHTMFVNPCMAKILGYSVDEMLGKHIFEFVDDKDVDRLKQKIKRRKKGIKEQYDFEFLRKDGSKVFCSLESTPVCDEKGNYEGALACVADITERKRAEHALLDSEEKYRNLMEHASDCIVVIQDDKIVYGNPAYMEFIGQLTENPSDSSFLDFIDPNEREMVEGIHALTIHGHQPLPYDVQFIADNGQRITMEVKSSTAPYHGNPAIMAVMRDITERKRAEEILKLNEELVRQQTDELERSNAELEQFAYVASHDLQEPLRMVSSYAQLLAKRYEGRLDDDADEFIGYAVDGANRMQTLINDLLILSRVGTMGRKFEPTECEIALEDAINNLKVGIEESGAIITHDSLPALCADHSQIAQLFQNLIANAVKFRGKDPPRIHISVEKMGAEYLFAVSDNGIGVPEEQHDRIFVIFQRLHNKEDYPGTGIGLAICKKIVERHRGQIWVDSQLNGGSIFYFTIPENLGEKNEQKRIMHTDRDFDGGGQSRGREIGKGSI